MLQHIVCHSCYLDLVSSLPEGPLLEGLMEFSKAPARPITRSKPVLRKGSFYFQSHRIQSLFFLMHSYWMSICTVLKLFAENLKISLFLFLLLLFLEELNLVGGGGEQQNIPTPNTSCSIRKKTGSTRLRKRNLKSGIVAMLDADRQLAWQGS